MNRHPKLTAVLVEVVRAHPDNVILREHLRALVDREEQVEGPSLRIVGAVVEDPTDVPSATGIRIDASPAASRATMRA